MSTSQSTTLRDEPFYTSEQAIAAFVRHELRAAARKLARHMRRIPPTGIYGDDQRARHLWDEFRFEVANGPTTLLEWDWELAVQPWINHIVDHIPEHSAKLISWYLASFEEDVPADAVYTDLLHEAVADYARSLAAD